jgi:transglutaminase-like putative cysteine protease
LLPVFSIALYFSIIFSFGPDNPGYSLKNIPEELTKGNHAVIREDVVSFEISTAASAKLTHKYAITLMDETADQFSFLVVPYDKNVKVLDIDGRVYNSEGALIDKLKPSEILDHSAEDGFSLYIDDRLKYARIVPSVYPCTIEFEYSVSYNGIISYPVWFPVEDENVSVQHSSFNVSLPDKMKLRFKEYNMKLKTEITQDQGIRHFRWQVSNLPSFRLEPFMPPLREVLPAVYTAPEKFTLDGHEGNMTTWKDFGEWVYNLNKGRDSLSSDKIEKIKSLAGNIGNKKERIRILYEYLKNNTRYVSVQLGIGGYQTFNAEFVSEHGYGDCKALSNYMHSLLKLFNIPSYTTLVYAGNNKPDIIYDFPSQQFNHAILCVPDEKDTLWLECTNQHNPFGYLGGFTSDRHVLIVTEKGGILRKTPACSKEMNTQVRTGDVYIVADGTSSAKIKTKATGLRYEPMQFMIHEDNDTQKKWIYNQIGIPDFTIKQFDFSEDNTGLPSITENLALDLNRYISTSGKRLFFSLNLMNQMTYTSAVNDARSFDLVFDFPYKDTDSIVFHIPWNYRLEFIPEPIRFDSDFGTYTMKVSRQDSTISYTRQLSRIKGRFSKDHYEDYRDFVQKIISTDKKKIVLIKSD